MAALSVLVTGPDPGSALPGLLRSIDAQTLPASEFEVVVVAGGSSAAPVRRWAERRPNVTVLTAPAGSADADPLDLVLGRATGEHLLAVTPQQRLAPRALELLLTRGRRTGAAVVLGRLVTGTASGSAVLADDADALEVVGIDPTACLAMVRRSSTTSRADLLAPAGPVGVVGRYACGIQDPRPDPPGEDVSPAPATLRWEAGRLEVAVEAPLPPQVSPAPRAWLVLRRGPEEIALPASTGPRDGNRATIGVFATLDPQVAEGGHPLADGAWALLLRLAWPGGETSVPLRVAGPARAAVVAGRPYVVRNAGHDAHLDAGGVRGGVLRAVPASQAAVAETVRGTLITLGQPDLHVHGDADLGARLLLDGFGVPARLVCRDGGARLEAYVGALAGTSALAAQVGGGRPAPTGLRLRVDGLGAMTVEDAPPAAGPAADRRPLVQRLRGRLPGAVEPMVRRLARVPLLRRAYRRAISR